MEIPERINAARAGMNKTVICRVPSGWAVLSDMQFLRGYIVHLADPLVRSINDLDAPARKQFLQDMVLIGDALMEITDCFRVNYFLAGNSDPYLHAHIIPRYLTELEQYRKGLPWSYPREVLASNQFDLERDQELMRKLAQAILRNVSGQ